MLPITLHQVGSLNDTGDTGHPVAGVAEIPMRYHTRTHLLLGICESAADCPVSMLHLQLVNIATGHIDNDIALDCQAGMVMTSIYANVSPGSLAHGVTAGFAGGKMGSDEDTDIQPHARRGKKQAPGHGHGRYGSQQVMARRAPGNSCCGSSGTLQE
ncbi:hypothetical protein [Rhodanobacter umsongensis]